MKKLSKKVVTLLKKKKLKFAVAESCTGGMLSSIITSIKGSSKVFTMGLVTYSDQSKNIVLKVPKVIIKKYGAVSIQCCFSMVNNLFKISKCNLAVSITGIAGPSGGTKQKPVGLVYIGIKKGNKVKINRYLFKKKGRSNIQKAAVRKCLNTILTIL
mgnify:CR=1 FL=1|tara:strand:- start:228 stop:698 length:471 start_codon:yes stop_codon:yes gene_type:complete